MRLAILVAVAILTITDGAEASERPRAIVLPRVITSEESLQLPSAEALYDEVVHTLQYCLEIDVLPREEVDAALVSGVGTCGSDVECIGRRLMHAGVTYGIEVILNARVEPPLLTAQLLDATKRTIERTHLEEVDPEARPITRTLRELMERFVRDAGWAIGGRLRVEALPADAAVTIEPAPAASHGPLHRARGGVYRVRASHDGFEDAEQTVVVTEREDAKVMIALEEQRFVGSVWFWLTLAGVAVAAGAVTTAVVLRPREYELCQTPGGVPCP